MGVLYIIRGLPGSGKSTLAKKLVPLECHKEADTFHMVDGVYDFKSENRSAAHSWCKLEVLELLKSGRDCAVSNTFTQRREYEYYLNIAKEFGYAAMVIDCYGPWKNTHNVPEDVLLAMKERFDPHAQSLGELLTDY